MLLKFPDLKVEQGLVQQRLLTYNASEESLAFWRQLVAEEILPESEDDEFD
jgi:hypothetical protein